MDETVEIEMSFPKSSHLLYLKLLFFTHKFINQDDLYIGETLDIGIDFEKRIHLLYFKLSIFYKNMNLEGL